MKKLILLLTIVTLAAQVQAQKINKSTVPKPAAATFKNAHPGVNDVDWKKNGDIFEAEYDVNKVETTDCYTAAGVLVETKEKLAAASVPAAIMAYVKKNYEEDEVRKAYKITSAGGTVTYKAKVKGMILFFDSEGKFVKSVKA